MVVLITAAIFHLVDLNNQIAPVLWILQQQTDKTKIIKKTPVLLLCIALRMHFSVMRLVVCTKIHVLWL